MLRCKNRRSTEEAVHSRRLCTPFVGAATVPEGGLFFSQLSSDLTRIFGEEAWLLSVWSTSSPSLPGAKSREGAAACDSKNLGLQCQAASSRPFLCVHLCHSSSQLLRARLRWTFLCLLYQLSRVLSLGVGLSFFAPFGGLAMVEASKSTRAAAEAAVDAKLGGTSKSEEGFKSGGDLKSENICKTAAANEAQGAPEASGQRPSSVPEEHSKSGVRPKTADRKKRKRRSWLSSGKRARRRRGEGSQGPNAAPSQGSAEDSSESESDTSSAVQTAQTAPSAAQHLRQLPPPTASEKFLPSRSLVPCQWQLYRHLKACDDRAELLAERFVIQAVDALNALLRRLRGQSLAEASDECKKEQSLSAARSRTARLLRRFQKDFGDRKTAVWELQGLSLSSCLRRLFVFVFEEALECLLYAQGFSGFQRLSDISVLAIKHLGLSERRLRPLISFLLATAPEASAAREKAWTDWCSLRVLRGLIPLDHYDILADFWRNAQQQLDRRPEASSRRRRDRTRGGQEESDGSASEESENFRKNKKPEAEDAEATPLAQVTLPGESRASALWGSDSCFFLDEFKRRSDELRREVLESPNFFLLLRFLCVYSQTLGVKWNFEGLLNALTTFSPPPDLLCLSLLLREAEFSFDFLKELQRADEELFKAANAASPDLDGASSAEATRLRRRSQILQQIQQRGIRTPRQTKPVAKKRKTAPASQAQQPPQASARAETASLGGGEEGEGEAEEGSRGQSAPETPSGAQRPSESRSPAAANGASEEADASGSVSPPREALDSRDAFLEVFALFRNSALEGTAPVEEASESDSRERRESLAFLALGKGPPLSESEAFGEENFAENGPPLLRKNAMDFDRWTEDDVDAGAGEEEGDEGCCVQRLLQRLLLLIGRKAGSPQQSLRTLRRYLDSRLDAEFAFSLLFLINPLEGVTRWTHLKPATVRVSCWPSPPRSELPRLFKSLLFCLVLSRISRSACVSCVCCSPLR